MTGRSAIAEMLLDRSNHVVSISEPTLEHSEIPAATEFDWPVCKQPPTLTLGAVHVWLLDLDLSKEPIDDLAYPLSPEEQQRASRFQFARDRNRYIAGRGQLRQLLALYLKIPATNVQFSYGPAGKPQLSKLHIASPIQFNLSHSENTALLGITSEAEIGIDIERIRKINDSESVAKYSFATNEFERLMALPEIEQEAAFFRCWTRKEAFLKARGTGITENLHSFEVDFQYEQKARLLSIRSELGGLADWSLKTIPIGADWCGAVAVHTPTTTLSFWRFDSLSDLT